MSVIIKGQFPKYSQYLLLLDFCFRFSSVIKICKICPYFLFHMKENKWIIKKWPSPNSPVIFFCSVLNEQSFFCNSSVFLSYLFNSDVLFI